MKKRVGSILTEHFQPENPKFRSPLILVHGPWSGSWCWQDWAVRFCNLGWDCWAVNFRGRAEDKVLESLARLTFDDCLGDLKQVIPATRSSPVLLGHSLGGLAAVKAAEGERISAVILLSAPFRGGDVKDWGRGLRLLRLKYLPLIFLRQPIRMNEKDFNLHWLASVPEYRRAAVLKGLVMESGYLVEELFRPSVSLDPKEIRCPVLVLGGTEDRVVSVASLRHMARALDAEFKEYPGHGHWMMEEEGREAIVNDIHRWLVQRLGEDVLLAEGSEEG
jgi:pimeloyl-ACP methyl ester carboxylesterase